MAPLAPPAAPPPAIAAPITVTAPPAFDLAPMRDAVAACDRDAMARLGKAEPHRRAEFARSAFEEQRAIASERTALPPIATTPTGKATLDVARAVLDARQKNLDDARATEAALRTAIEEMRADFLANCGKRD